MSAFVIVMIIIVLVERVCGVGGQWGGGGTYECLCGQTVEKVQNCLREKTIPIYSCHSLLINEPNIRFTIIQGNLYLYYSKHLKYRHSNLNFYNISPQYNIIHSFIHPFPMLPAGANMHHNKFGSYLDNTQCHM